MDGLGGWVVGKSDFKENPKSDLDLDLGFVSRALYPKAKFIIYISTPRIIIV